MGKTIALTALLFSILGLGAVANPQTGATAEATNCCEAAKCCGDGFCCCVLSNAQCCTDGTCQCGGCACCDAAAMSKNKNCCEPKSDCCEAVTEDCCQAGS